MRVDAAVLGAGIVGICAALHLQARGRATVLLDRRAPCEETSFGNAGLIQREGVVPYAFPRDLGTLLRHALGRSTAVHYHASALAALAPFLWRYWCASRPERHADIARRYAPLIERSLDEHERLAAEAGAEALFRRTGWLRVFHTARERDAHLAEAERVRREFGVEFEALEPPALARLEPRLSSALAGGLWWPRPLAVVDPRALALAYLGRFERLGGRFVRGDARTLEPGDGHWRLGSAEGPIEARDVVVALGPWADELTRALGYRLPLAVKRGYHMHYRAADGAALGRPVLDSEHGYCLAPMTRGVRLTTGAEFALRDAPKTPVQLERVEPVARALFPLGERLDPEPWMGARPCTPDMLPVIGRAPRHANLWFAFGHAHHGLTLAAVTGRLVAELICGEAPLVDPSPYRADRF
ncbi:MAG: FAD-binding oxidoreductase [Burkholderiales bacterium]|nr:FAD-binding oxidoreductase [Burkholderiales bacterium]